MLFALGEIWISLILALLLGFFLAWLLWKWRRRSVDASQWEELNGELAARRRSIADLERENSRLLTAQNAAEAEQVRQLARIDDLTARADLVPALEARVAEAEAARPAAASPAATSPAASSPAATEDAFAEARRAAAMATGVVQSDAGAARSSLAAEGSKSQSDASVERANERARELAAQLDASSTAVEELEAERQELTSISEARHRRIRQLEKEMLSLNGRIAKANEDLAKANEDAAQARAVATRAEVARPPVAPSLDTDPEVSRRAVAQAKAELATSEARLATIQNELDNAHAEISARTEQTTNLQIELQRRGGELERRVIEGNRATSNYQQELSAREARIDDLSHELDGVAQALDEAQGQIAELTAGLTAAEQRERNASERTEDILAGMREREANLLAQARDGQAARTAEIANQRDQIVAQQSEISSLGQRIAEAHAETSNMRDRLVQANQRAEELGRGTMRLKALEARVAHLSAGEAELVNLRARQVDLERRAERADALQAETAEQRRELRELTSKAEAAEQRALRVVELEGRLRASELEADRLRSGAGARIEDDSGDEITIPDADRTPMGDAEQAELAELRVRVGLVSQLEQRVSSLQRELAELRNIAAAAQNVGDQPDTKDRTDKDRTTKDRAGKGDDEAVAVRKEIAALKKSLAKADRAAKQTRHDTKKLEKHHDAKVADLQSSLKSLQRDAKQNSATIAALRHDLVKARKAKAGHRDKRLRSAEEKVAQLEAQGAKINKRSTKAGAKKSKSVKSKGPAKKSTKGPDDLKRIHGIGPRLERTLNDMGITRFEQLASLKKADIERLQKKLPKFPGRVVRDNWVGQAKALAKKR